MYWKPQTRVNSARGSALLAFERTTLEQQDYTLRVRAERMPAAIERVAAARAAAAEQLFELVDAIEARAAWVTSCWRRRPSETWTFGLSGLPRKSRPTCVCMCAWLWQ